MNGYDSLEWWYLYGGGCQMETEDDLDFLDEDDEDEEKDEDDL